MGTFTYGLLFVFVALGVALWAIIKLFGYALSYEGSAIESILLKSLRAIMESGLAGPFAAFGVMIYFWNLLISTYNPAAYANSVPLQYLPYVSAAGFLLAIVISIFRSLRAACITGLIITSGILSGELLVSLVLNTALAIDRNIVYLVIVMLVVIALVGGDIIMIGLAVYFVIETIGIFGVLLFILFAFVGAVMLPSASSLVSFFGGSGSVTPVAFTFSSLGVTLLLLAMLSISTLLEKRIKTDK